MLPSSFTFTPSDARDHCETPAAAFEHLAPVLRALAAARGVASSELRLYDPYYCTGASARHLSACGFPRTRNENEDFYAVVAGAAPVPQHDVVVTNPPFSGDHVERALAWCCRRAGASTAWAMLLPAYTTGKPHFHELSRALRADATARGWSGPTLLFLGPARDAYAFDAPPFARPAGATAAGAPVAVRAGTFQCVWFLFLGRDTSAALSALGVPATALAGGAAAAVPGTAGAALLATTPGALPQLAAVRRPTPAQRRWRRKLAALPPHERLAAEAAAAGAAGASGGAAALGRGGAAPEGGGAVPRALAQPSPAAAQVAAAATRSGGDGATRGLPGVAAGGGVRAARRAAASAAPSPTAPPPQGRKRPRDER